MPMIDVHAADGTATDTRASARDLAGTTHTIDAPVDTARTELAKLQGA